MYLTYPDIIHTLTYCSLQAVSSKGISVLWKVKWMNERMNIRIQSNNSQDNIIHLYHNMNLLLPQNIVHTLSQISLYKFVYTEYQVIFQFSEKYNERLHEWMNIVMNE